MLILYDYFRSSACYRVRIALNLKELDYDILPIHLVNNGGEQYSVEYQRVNPQGLVPALHVNNMTITQSMAIIEYLDEAYPLPPILPKSIEERALVRAFALSIVADVHPLNNLRVLKYLTNDLNITDTQKTTWYQHWIHTGLSALEQQLVFRAAPGDFCFGNQPTLADICLIPQLYNAKRFHCDLNAYPTLSRIDKHCQQLAAFTNAKPTEVTA